MSLNYKSSKIAKRKRARLVPYQLKEGEEFEKPDASARPGNIALDIERPLFQKGPNWQFTEFKN